MRVLIVCSGNSKNGISPIVKNQVDSLKKKDLQIEYFLIKGKGLKGYIKNILPLKTYQKKNKFEIIHAHYSLSGIVASIAGAKPLVVSLMGSDVEGTFFWRIIIKIFNLLFWNAIIVKSTRMKTHLGIKTAFVIPNGVDFTVFKPSNKTLAQNKVNFNKKKHIVFLADPQRKEKNFPLAKTAVKFLNNKNCELNVIYNVEHSIIPVYINAADVILMTSLWEGSPNIIKEAMACNCPIVSTDVGDVKEIFGNTNGCFLTGFEPKDVAQKIKQALEFGKRTNGRSNIEHLESPKIADKIISIYNEIKHN